MRLNINSLPSLTRRSARHTHSSGRTVLSEEDEYLGFYDDNKVFFQVAVLSEKTEKDKRDARSKIETLLERSPNLGDDVKNGLLRLSVEGDRIYFHHTIKSYKDRLNVVNGRPVLTGVALEEWAQLQVKRNEEHIASRKATFRSPIKFVHQIKAKLGL